MAAKRNLQSISFIDFHKESTNAAYYASILEVELDVNHKFKKTIAFALSADSDKHNVFSFHFEICLLGFGFDLVINLKQGTNDEQ